MSFVERRGGKVVGVYSTRQPGYAEEELADDHPDVAQYRTPRQPPDLSESNNLDKALKAALLCVAQVGGLTPAQIRAMFKQKFDSLP